MEAAEEQKQRIEQLQRDRRRVLEESNVTHQPKFFRLPKYPDLLVSCDESHLWESERVLFFNSLICSSILCHECNFINTLTHLWHFLCLLRKSKDDTWVSNNTYWELRKDLGFAHIDFPTLW